MVGRPHAPAYRRPCFFALVAPANATITAINKPPIVKGSTDTFWFSWLNDSPSTTYSLCYWVSINGGSFVRPSGLSCSGTGGDTGLLTGGGGYKSVQLNVADGNTYRVCASQKVAGLEGGLSCMPAGMTPRADNTAPEMSFLWSAARRTTPTARLPGELRLRRPLVLALVGPALRRQRVVRRQPRQPDLREGRLGVVAADGYRTDFADCNLPRQSRDTTGRTAGTRTASTARST